MSLSAAKSRVLQARTQIETGRLDDVEPTLTAAEGFLDNVDPLDAAPATALRAQIAEIRAEMAAVLMPDQRTRLSAAEGKLRQAADQRAMGLRAADIEVTLDQAAELLEGLPEQHTETVRARLAAERAQLPKTQEPAASVPPVPATSPEEPVASVLPVPATSPEEPVSMATQLRRGELDRQLSRAENDLEWNADSAERALRRVIERLQDDDVIAALGAGGIAEYRAKVDALDTRRQAAIVAAALERARPLAAGLEVLLAEGLPTGWGELAVDRATSEMRSLVSRARQALEPVEDAPAEVDALRIRVDAGAAAIDGMIEDWRVRMRAQGVQQAWSVLLDGVADWADETDSVADHPLEEPRLPKTREAVQRLRHFVQADPGEDSAAVWAVHREAEAMFERAGAKLDAAFNAMLDDADTRPVPLRGPDLDRPRHLATAARYTFEGTRFLEANVARCEALHERWQAEVTAVMAARQELWDRLAREASQAWPAVVAKHAPGDFTTEPGATVLLERVHNRAGWEYAGDVHPFALRYDGVVLAADYEPHVLAALEHAWFELKLDVNDRIPWSVIAVVEGPGAVGERTVRFGREEWPLIPCVQLRIIALHAGPVVA